MSASTDADADDQDDPLETDDTEPLELAYPQLTADPDPVRRHRRSPAGLAQVVDACLEREPASRPTLPEVLVALEAWLASRARPGADH
jgi:hypothetical protein